MPWIQPSLTSLQCDPHLPSLFILSVFSSSMCYLDINDARGAAGFDLPRAHGEIPMASTSPHLCADGSKSIYSSTSNELRLKNKHLKFNPNHAKVLSSPWGKNNPLLSLGWSSQLLIPMLSKETQVIFYFLQVPVDHQNLMIFPPTCLTTLVPQVHSFLY